MHAHVLMPQEYFFLHHQGILLLLFSTAYLSLRFDIVVAFKPCLWKACCKEKSFAAAIEEQKEACSWSVTGTKQLDEPGDDHVKLLVNKSFWTAIVSRRLSKFW